jgi:hypothetical protein
MKKQKGATTATPAIPKYGTKSIGDYTDFMNEISYGGKDDFDTQ